MRILSISSSRADVGILAPVWQAMAAEPDVALCVLLTGMHAIDDSVAREALPEFATVHLGGKDLGGGGYATASRAMGASMTFAADVYDAWKPDLILAVGDRLDMIPAVLAAVPFHIPIAHLHGGELTYGAVDNDIRHAMTKLAHLHCVGSVESARRLNGMGEEAWRIHVTGGPGLDTILAVPEMKAADFAARVGLPDAKSLRLVTIHPETRASEPAACVDQVLAAFEARPGTTLFTAPNSDPGGALIRLRIKAFVEAHADCVFRETLGSALYANALRHADLMIGNSSSGLIEAPLFDLPVINVGDRQEGRERAANVHDCRADVSAIVEALDSIDPASRASTGVSPYGDGKSGPRIARILCDAAGQPDIIRKRHSAGGGVFRAPWDIEIPHSAAG